MIDNFDAEYDYVTNEGTVFTFKSNLKAPKYKVLNIDFAKPEPEHWTTLIGEHADDVLEYVTCINKDKLIVIYMHDVKVRQIHVLLDMDDVIVVCFYITKLCSAVTVFIFLLLLLAEVLVSFKCYF